MSQVSEPATASLTRSIVETTAAQHASGEKRTRVSSAAFHWQFRLLPLMSGMLIVLTAFFFIASFVQLYYLQTRIERSPKLDLAPTFRAADDIEVALKSPAFDKSRSDRAFEYTRWRTLLLLDANALEHRYYQAGILLISRTWTRYLGFVTGMILALVGAVFILGKLSESSSQIGAETSGWKVSVTSASPGLILAVLGTTLMLATLATHLDMQVNDGPVFFPLEFGEQSQQPTPQPLTPDQAKKPGADTNLLNQMRTDSAAKQ